MIGKKLLALEAAILGSYFLTVKLAIFSPMWVLNRTCTQSLRLKCLDPESLFPRAPAHFSMYD